MIPAAIVAALVGSALPSVALVAGLLAQLLDHLKRS
jgi:hypothetical protein